MARKRKSAARTATDITTLGVTTMVGGITVGHVARLPTGAIYSGLGLMPVAGVIMAGGAVVEPLRMFEKKPKRRRG